MQQTNKQLIIFAKAPVVGHCKTRLIPLLGEHASTELYKQLSRHCLNQLNNIHNTSVSLQTYPDTDHEFVNELQKSYAIELSPQVGNNLGERMHYAIQQSLEKFSQCILIGTDCPEINSSYINAAFNALQSSDIVLGPAHDGGYVLIGANRIQAELFTDIDWSTERVLQQQINNCKKLNYTHQLLPELWDLDLPEDYIRHQQRLKQLAII